MNMKHLSTNEARKIIHQLSRIDLNIASFEYLTDCIRRLMHGNAFQFNVMPLHTVLFRCIPYSQPPKNSSELGYPPSHISTNFQRCNAPFSPMFYCAEDPGIAIHEIRPQTGTEIYVSRWKTNRSFSVGFLTLPADNKYHSDASRLVYSFFEKQFTQPIIKSSEKYKITAAISKCISTGGAPLDHPELGAVIYSSVAHSSKGRNIAIWPHIIDSSLELIDVERIVITEALDRDFIFSRLDYANDFDKGKIHWKGVPLLPQFAGWGKLISNGVNGSQTSVQI